MVQQELRYVLEAEKDPTKAQQKKIASDQKKRTAKNAAKFVSAQPHFGPSASAEEAGKTIHNCAKEVVDQDREKEGIPLSKPHTDKEMSKGYAICTKTAAIHGATGDKATTYDKGSECARVGGKTPEEC